MGAERTLSLWVTHDEREDAMEYNPFLPEVKDNPYPYYAYLRR